jgi:hypothetical protein
MSYYRVCNYITTTGDTSGAETVYPSGAPESAPVFSGIRVIRFLVLCVCFVDRCLLFCTFSFGHCVFCSSSIYECSSHEWNIYSLSNLWEYEPRYRQLFHFLECYSSDLINILKIFASNLWRDGGFCSSSKIGRNDIAAHGPRMTINTHHAHQLVVVGW